ncbi:hypothetical protein J2Y41_002505 [Arthrobacter sp. 1088]|uniref:hypothetical protein n=1 Tax=Arthrobacter sp. 1088 TaxID=2817768 RepID=UPI0028601911|nr:hypothetical protein [Arthrobacter sp. 1088]MDR6686942.1 hypothetical protein [Arthrobacter sp. 1088]
MPRRHIRPGALSRRKLAARYKLATLRHTRNPEHLRHCPECRAALNRERQYLERLRGAAVPEASQDLTARLLQHTQRLADEQAAPVANPRTRRGAWRALRIAGVAAGTLTASAGALGLAAYAVAGDTAPKAAIGAGNGASSLSSAFTGGPAELMMTSESVATPDFRPTGPVNLSSEQLDALRDQGWACPELGGMGFHVVAAKATMHNGHPAVELRLESNGHYATVLEEHLQGSDIAVTGRPASAQLSLTQGTPWEAVYRTSAAVLSYSSDLPADVADDAVPELVRAGDSMVSNKAPQASETWSERMIRGLRTLLRPAGL